jgi:hypothetical protein
VGLGEGTTYGEELYRLVFLALVSSAQTVLRTSWSSTHQRRASAATIVSPRPSVSSSATLPNRGRPAALTLWPTVVLATPIPQSHHPSGVKRRDAAVT